MTARQFGAWRGVCAALAVAIGPAAAAGLSARYTVDAAGLTVVGLTAMLDIDDEGYSVQATTRTRGVAALLVAGHMSSRAEGHWRGTEPGPDHYRADGVWRGTERHTEVDYEQGRPLIRRLEPPGAEDRYPVAAEQQGGTSDPLSALAQLVRQVRDTGRCDGRIGIFEGRQRLEVTTRTDGIEHLDGGRGDWSGDAVRCVYEVRTVAGARRDQDPAEAARPERGVAWIAAPAPGLLPIPVRIEAALRWFGKATLRLVAAEPAPAP